MENSLPTKPKVTLITVNFRGLQQTRELLLSVRKLTYPNLETIVVDNGSEPEEASVLQREFPEAKIIRSEKNLGFAGGNNLAIPEATGDYFYFINNDTEIPDGSIEVLIDTLKSTPKGGIVSPRIIFHHTPDTLQFAGFRDMHPITLRTSAVGFGEKDKGQFQLSNTYSIHGAAMMINRECLEKVGPMWDGYFLYAEEFDWSLRIREAGYAVLVQPAAHIFHKESMSTGKNSPLKTYYLNRNRIWFARRNFKQPYKFLAVAYIYFFSCPVNLFRNFRQSKAHFKSYRRALWEGLGKMG
jgi:GT2 family glycosyltransferase